MGFKLSLKKVLDASGDEKQSTEVKNMKGLTMEEVMAAVTGHEIEHTTPENVKLDFEGKPEDVEKKPSETQRKIIDEFKEEK